jgi:hypothetical protein
MSTELKDLRQRVEGLESYLDTLEYRLGVNETLQEIAPTKRVGVEVNGEQGDEVPSRDPAFGRLEAMLRSVLFHQGSQSTDLRRVIRNLQILVERRVS